MKALLLGLLGICAGMAVGKTVVWYPMEGAAGARAETAIENCAEPGRLTAAPKSLVGAALAKDTVSNPTFASGFPADWKVYDPVGQKSHRNSTALRSGSRSGSR